MFASLPGPPHHMTTGRPSLCNCHVHAKNVYVSATQLAASPHCSNRLVPHSKLTSISTSAPPFGPTISKLPGHTFTSQPHIFCAHTSTKHTQELLPAAQLCHTQLCCSCCADNRELSQNASRHSTGVWCTHAVSGIFCAPCPAPSVLLLCTTLCHSDVMMCISVVRSAQQVSGTTDRSRGW